VNGNVKLWRAAARSGEWAQHFSNASCFPKFQEPFALSIANLSCRLHGVNESTDQLIKLIKIN